MRQIITEIHEVYGWYNRLVGLRNKIPDSYDADDQEQIDHYYDALAAYVIVKDEVREGIDRIKRYDDQLIYIRLADAEAYQRFQTLMGVYFRS